jgi:hypothetical protein
LPCEDLFGLQAKTKCQKFGMQSEVSLRPKCHARDRRGHDPCGWSVGTKDMTTPA